MATPIPDRPQTNPSRRGVLSGVAGAAFAGVVAPMVGCATGGGASALAQTKAPPKDYHVTHGNINQSVVHWCFNLTEQPGHQPMTEAELAGHAKKMGVKSVELIAPSNFAMLTNNGMTCAIATIDIGGPPFMKGFNNPRYHELVINATRDAIDAAAEHGIKRVICFNGYSQHDLDDPNSGHISDDEGAENCVNGFKKIIGHAEAKKVTLCLEMLNTRDDSHPMKGHPGYQGDDVEYCVDIINRVASPNLKLLFDVYHVQIMNGDVIRRIRQHKDVIGHYHTAGNPGRRELDEQQEINYPAVMRAIAETNYDGFVAQEFIPTWDDKMAALRHAVKLCDV
jgi:hydroxypyruvate isomerase